MRKLEALLPIPPYLKASLIAVRADLATYLGGFSAAEEMLGKWSEGNLGVQCSVARLNLFRGKQESALAQAEELLGHDLLPRYYYYVSLIAAVAAWELGRSDEAFAYLRSPAGLISEFGGTIVLGGVPYDPLLEAARAAAAEAEAVESPDQKIFADLVAAVEKLPAHTRAARREELSQAEIKVLRALNLGLTRADIARTLCISQNTVKFHLRSIYRKFRVSSRAEALEYADVLGLLRPEEGK